MTILQAKEARFFMLLCLTYFILSCSKMTMHVYLPGTALSSAVDTSANASLACQLKQVASESSKTQSTDSTAKAPRRAQLISLSVKRDHSGETKANGSNDLTNTSLPVPMETSLINAPVTGSAGYSPPKGIFICLFKQKGTTFISMVGI